MSSGAQIRQTARVVVLDPAGRVLLLGSRLTDPAVPPGDVQFWYTPGGGVEDGETVRTAAVRELAEEIGLVADPASMEGPVWFRRHVAPFIGILFDSRETFFVLREKPAIAKMSGWISISWRGGPGADGSESCWLGPAASSVPAVILNSLTPSPNTSMSLR